MRRRANCLSIDAGPRDYQSNRIRREIDLSHSHGVRLGWGGGGCNL